MPDLVTPRRGVRHTVDSAVPALLRLAVDLDRIELRCAGLGWAPGTVVGQSPAPGAPLAPESRVVLDIAGRGAIDNLPYLMRDSAEREFRSDRLFGLFDSHFLKLLVHLRAAGGLLDLHPDDADGANRWITEIFRLSAAPWPEERWYDVARLLPSLAQIAGRPDGPAIALRSVFRLPASPVRLVPGIAAMPAARRTRLGQCNGRLGVDAIVGAGITASTSAEIEIGPVDLPTYRRMQRPEERRQRDAIYRLVLPVHLQGTVTERWIVGERAQAAVLGDPGREAALGLNSYLGSPEARSAA